jgi:hypothetical protein
VKAFLVVAGAVFGLVVVAHLMRIGAEPHLARDPRFILITIAAGALSTWAWILVGRGRHS